MAKASAKTSTDPISPRADGKGKSNRKSTSKGDSSTVPNPNVDDGAPNTRGKKATTRSASKDQQPLESLPTKSASRKRQANQVEEQSQGIPVTPDAAGGLNDQPPTKKRKKQPSKKPEAAVGPDDQPPTKNPKKQSSTGAGTKNSKDSSSGASTAAKENVPPLPAAAASKSKKPTASERREQQMKVVEYSGKP